jgi:hypothetical protein
VAKEVEKKKKSKGKKAIEREDRGRHISKEYGSWTTQQVKNPPTDALEHLAGKKER